MALTHDAGDNVTTFRTGRQAQLAHDVLLGASGCEAVALDRLAAALSLAHSGDEPLCHADDGREHEAADLDRFDGAAVLRLLLRARSGAEAETPDGRVTDLLQGHLNRGYDLLYRGFQDAREDWEATLAAISPHPEWTPARRARRSDVPAIRLTVGTGLGEVDGDSAARVSEEIVWELNREAGRQTNANARLAGMPGVGKSQFLLELLAQSAACGPGFVLLDYKGDLSSNREFVAATGARVIRPTAAPIPINPFQLPSSVPARMAPRAFGEVFRALAPGIGDVQRARVTRAVERAYAELEPGGPGYPTLMEVTRRIREVYAEEGLADDTLTAALGDLTSYQLFAERSEQPLSEVFQVRWIVDLAELSALRDFVAFALLEFLHQAARGLPDSAYDARAETRELRGVVAIDEAHYYLRTRCQPLLDLLRVGRSKGVPIFLASQSLDDFRGRTELNEFLPNTFVLRHGVPPDRKTMSGALSVGTREAERVAERTASLEKFESWTSLSKDPETGACRPVRLRGFWERQAKSSGRCQRRVDR